MNCSKCGQPLTGGSAFCSRCGTPTGLPQDMAPDGGEPTFVPVRGAEVLDGKWKLERKIGEGGMGAVYLAHDLQLDRKVAIKILASALTHDAELVARFEREARFTASLEHPNIVPIYAVGRFRNRPFMVMKYLEGQPLSALLRAQSVLPLEQVLALTRQVCGGLEFIHAKGYVHRDIKAGNIFIGPSGLATILDFGILRPRRNAESLTRTGMVMGTPQYMSPEQALGEKEIDQRSDLYALAVVIYECLAGMLPFDSDSDLSIIQMQAHAQAPDICARAGWISRPVGDMVMRALAKRPQDRYQSAAELSSAFEAAVALQDMFHDSSASISISAQEEPASLPPAFVLSASPPPGSLSPVVPDPIPLEQPMPAGEGTPRTAPSARMSGSKVAPTAALPVRLTPVSAPGGQVAVVMPEALVNGGAVAERAAAAGTPEVLVADAAEPEAPEPEMDFGPSTGELAKVVRRRSRSTVVAAAALLGVVVLGAAYLALSPGPVPVASPPPEPEASVPDVASAAPAEPPVVATDPMPSPPSTDSPPPEDPIGLAVTEDATEVEEAPPESPGSQPSVTTRPAVATRPPVRQYVPSSGATGMGKVNVVTTYRGGPYWASIQVNGEDRGTTPVLLELPAGRHRIRVDRAGFKPIEKQIKVAPGRPVVLRIELIP